MNPEICHPRLRACQIMSPRESSACDLLSTNVSLTDAPSRKVSARNFTLAAYDNSGYSTGASLIRNLLWYLVGGLIFETRWFPFRSLKVVLLRWLDHMWGPVSSSSRRSASNFPGDC